MWECAIPFWYCLHPLRIPILNMCSAYWGKTTLVSCVIVNILIRSFRGLWTVQRRVIPVRRPALRHKSMTQNVKCGTYNICVRKINFTLKSLHFIITKVWPLQWKSSNFLLSAHGKCSSLIYTRHVCTSTQSISQLTGLAVSFPSKRQIATR